MTRPVLNYLGDIDPQAIATVLRRDIPQLHAAVQAMIATKADDRE